MRIVSDAFSSRQYELEYHSKEWNCTPVEAAKRMMIEYYGQNGEEAAIAHELNHLDDRAVLKIFLNIE